MPGSIQDLRYALRQFARAPGFALVVMVTLSLGIGATTSMFSFVSGVLLRPLPYPEAHRIVMVCETSPERPAEWCGASPSNWADWVRRSRTLEHAGLGREWSFGIAQEGRTRGVAGGIATPGLFEVFGARPVRGRLFEPRDIQRGNEHVAIISYGFWQAWFGGSGDVLGKQLNIDGEVYEIAGVLPADFAVPRIAKVDVWIPLWPERLTARGWRGFASFGKLREGVTLEQARAEMSSLRNALAQEFPETNAAWGVQVDSLHERTVRTVRPALLVFLAAVFGVLLIACANVANLFLARGASREREFAVRLALGAGRLRLTRQLLLEGLLYAAGGGLLGVLGAYWAVDAFRGLAPAWFPRIDTVQVDDRVLAFSVAVTVVTSLLFGLAPALAAGRLNLNDTLRDARSGGIHRGIGRLREALVVTEIALACVLLVSAGLLLRSFGNLLEWTPGFNRENLVMVSAFLSPGKYPKVDAVTEVFRRGVEEIRAVPGVVTAGAGSAVPLLGGDGEQEFYIEGRTVPGAGERPSVWWYDVDPNYFQTLGIPLLRGRHFTEADNRGAAQVAIVNETTARRHWPNENPIGQRIHLLTHKKSVEIVGVVGDVRPFRPDEAPKAEIYWPFAQAPRWAIMFIARTAGPPSSVTAALQTRLEAFEPDMDLGRMRTMDEQVSRQLVNPRFNMILGGLFAALAVAIASVGIYGVMSFGITRRTHEFGIRMALGALPGDVLRMVLGRGLLLAAMGLSIGLAGALGVTRLLRALLIGVAPSDPLTFVACGAVLLGVALAACYVPARRATRVDPLVALRYE
jgi:putative ABC transport system permease protein